MSCVISVASSPSSARVPRAQFPMWQGKRARASSLQTASGAPIEVTGTLAAPGYPPRPPDRLEIVGSKASATFENSELRLLGDHPRSETYDRDHGYQASFDG